MIVHQLVHYRTRPSGAPALVQGSVGDFCLTPPGLSPVVSVTRTSTELSIVCPAALAPAEAEVDGPWSAWYIRGPIPFGLTGVVQSVVSPLSTRGIPVFVVSTFDSDLIMAPADRATDAASALVDAGHEIDR